MEKIEFNVAFNEFEISQAKEILESEHDLSEYDYVEIPNKKYMFTCKVCGRGKYTYVPIFRSFMPCQCDCEKKAEEEKEHKRKADEAEIKFKRRQATISHGYRDIYLSDSDTKLDKIENFINNFPQFMEKSKGLMIYGEVGNGKTFMASCIANELCKRGYTVAMYHILDALKQIGEFDNGTFMETIQTVDLLIIDDFGASRNTEYRLEQLVNLIDMRYQTRKPLVITTNMDRKDLIENVSIGLERTYNRLIEMTHPLKIETPCRRIKKAKEEFAELERLLNA